MGAVILNIGLEIEPSRRVPGISDWRRNLGTAARLLLLWPPHAPVGMFLEPMAWQTAPFQPAEPTLVARLEITDPARVSDLCWAICKDTSQDCIAAKWEGTPYGEGYLFGPRPGKWLPFNEDYFIPWRS